MIEIKEDDIYVTVEETKVDKWYKMYSKVNPTPIYKRLDFSIENKPAFLMYNNKDNEPEVVAHMLETRMRPIEVVVESIVISIV